MVRVAVVAFTVFLVGGAAFGCRYDYEALRGAGGGPGTGGAGLAGGGSGGGTGGDRTGGSGGPGGSGGDTGGTGGGDGTGGTGGDGSGGAGTGGRGGTGGRADPDLVLWYKFDDASGTTAADSSTAAGPPRDALLRTAGTGGEIGFSTMRQAGTHAVSLTANGSTGGGYLVVPSVHDLAPNALTISVWVYVNTAQRWQRVFDLGNSTTTNLALTTQNGSDAVRFVIRTDGNPEQAINSTTILSASAWHHLVVVLSEGSPYTGQLFVDGALVASNAQMTLHPADLGPTANNYLGKSQFTDPYFAGLIDDFRVYRRALTQDQIATLFALR
jgi:hypothetical protein